MAILFLSFHSNSDRGRVLGVKKIFLLLRNVWLFKHKEGTHSGFCRHVEQHSGSWTMSVFTLLVVKVVKPK